MSYLYISEAVKILIYKSAGFIGSAKSLRQQKTFHVKLMRVCGTVLCESYKINLLTGEQRHNASNCKHLSQRLCCGHYIALSWFIAKNKTESSNTGYILR